MLSHEQAEHAGMVIGFEPFDLQMMFGLAITVEAKLIGELHIAFHLFEKSLIQFRALTRHTLLNLAAATDDSGLHQVKFHPAPISYPPTGRSQPVPLVGPQGPLWRMLCQLPR